MIGLACVASARNYLITGRTRETREGERRPPLLFSPWAPPPPKKKKTGAHYAGHDWPYSGTFLRVSKHGKNLAGKDQGRGR